MIPVLAIVASFVVLSAVVWRKKHQSDMRSLSMEQVADLMQLQYTPNDSFGLIPQLQGFELFERERSRWFGKGRISNVLRGWVGETQVYLFDYSYTVQAGKSRKKVTQTVFFANDKNWFLPNFHLKPERWWHKLQASLGIKSDINFEENPRFSNKFWLNGDFEALIRKQFTPELQGFLTEKPPAHLEGSNYYLIAYKPKESMNAADLQLFYQHCCEMVGLLQKKGDVTELLDLAEWKREAIKIPRSRG